MIWIVSPMEEKKCKPFRIEFADQGKWTLMEKWTTSKTWCIQMYVGPEPYLGPVQGALFTIRLEVQTNSTVAIGYNSVLVPQEALVTRSPGGGQTPVVHLGTNPQSQDSSYGQHPLWDLVLKSFQVINALKPNLTKECWLYLNTQPPYPLSMSELQ